jgi:hypothetical protein
LDWNPVVIVLAIINNMNEERTEIVQDSAAPRWIGIAVGDYFAGWGDDVLGQRLAKAEDTNAQLEGELSVITDKMKLTQTELTRARSNQENQGR